VTAAIDGGSEAVFATKVVFEPLVDELSGSSPCSTRRTLTTVNPTDPAAYLGFGLSAASR
jgi:hypothetical protein